MAKLNQIVAVVSGKKTRMEKDFGELNKIVQKRELFDGMSRTYVPKDDGGEELPPERKLPQKSVADVVVDLKKLLASIMDAVATQEYGNTHAKADVSVDGTVVLSGVPVTALLYLEKQLTDLGTFVGNFPVWDLSESWEKNEGSGYYQTEPTKTVRKERVQKPIVLQPPTVEHPAQTQMITEEVTTGHWLMVKFSTAISPVQKKAILERITKLQDAVKVAREEANSVDVKDVNIAAPVLKFVFG